MKMHLLLIILTLISCNSPRSNEDNMLNRVSNNMTTDNKGGFKLIEGIYVEEIDSTEHGENRYNQDNVIYQVEDTFIYSYSYIDTTGNIFYSDQKSSWEFVPLEGDKKQSENRIILTVAPGLLNPDHMQTQITYSYSGGPYYSATGVIENKKNVWLHPPRDGLFKILELNPFPFIQAPFRVGHRWKWRLNIGGQWGDKRWMIWDETTNIYNYEIISIKNIECFLGKVECFVIESTASSDLGTTSLTAYFNVYYGFIKLDYTNINGSRLLLELVNHKRNSLGNWKN